MEIYSGLTLEEIFLNYLKNMKGEKDMERKELEKELSSLLEKTFFLENEIYSLGEK